MSSSDEGALGDVGDENPWPNFEAEAVQHETHDAYDDAGRYGNLRDEEQLSPSTTAMPTVTRDSDYRPSEQGSGHRASFPSIITSQTHGRTRRRKSRRVSIERHHATWAYSKYALLFFISLLVTWVSYSTHPTLFSFWQLVQSTLYFRFSDANLKVPSSANRIYSLAAAPSVSFGLNYVSAFVLPLQGFWNCLVYIATSTSGVKSLFTTKPRKPSIAASFDNLQIKSPSSLPIAPLKRINAKVRRLWTRDR